MDIRGFGSLLHDYRHAAGLSLRRLADRADVNHGSLSHTESGKRERRLPEDAVERIDAALAAEGAILRAWRSLPPTQSRQSTAPIPNQLPPAAAITDRDDLMGQLVEIVERTADDDSPTVILLTGTGGIGKTALAVAAGHRLTLSREGALFVDLRGWHETIARRDTADVLHRWCRSLGANPEQAAGDRDELIALWRSLTAGREFLVVLDNAKPDQVDDLLPASHSCVILVTSRARTLDTSVPVHLVRVSPLLSRDAIAMLAEHSGMRPATIRPLAERCDGLPLALRVLADDAAAHWTEEDIADMVRDFDALPHRDPVERSTELSYRQLSETTARAWRLLAHVGDPSLGAAAAALGLPEVQMRDLLREASDANLLERSSTAWTYHDLHREYALKISRGLDSPEEIHAAVRHALVWFLHGIAAADLFFSPPGDLPELIPLPLGVQPPAFSSSEEAMTWLDARWQYLVPAVQLAVRWGWADLAWQLSIVPVHYAFLTKPWASWSRACTVAGEAAELADDTEGVAAMQLALGSIASDQERYADAVAYADRSLELRRPLGHQQDIGWSAIGAARWRIYANAPDAEIEPRIDDILTAHGAVGCHAGVCLAWTFRAMLARRRGETTTALDHLHHALDELDEHPPPGIYLYVLCALAESEVDLGRISEARDNAQLANERATATGTDYFRISALITKADTYDPATDRDHLTEILQFGLALAEKINDPRQEQIRERLDQLNI